MFSRLRIAVGACVAVTVAGAAWLLPLRRETLQTPFADPRKEARWAVDDSRAVAVRELALRQARVWVPPPDPSTADLAANPPDPNGNLSGDLVRCRYLDGPHKGTTPKFDCVLSDGEIVKVKYGSTTEIQGELAASRFLTALGFGADRMYLVRRLRCFGCLRTPYHAAWLLDWLNLRGAAQSLLPDNRYSDFEWAAVERHFEGREIVSPDRSGWSWGELDRIDLSRGANRAERDALRLVSLLIAHSDTKPSNQRLVCVADRGASDTCPRPFALIHDLGDTFGLKNGGLTQWKKFGIWKNRERCAVTMREFQDDRATFRDRYISEEGRQLLARQLRMLNDAQIEALFASTRVTRVSGSGNAEVWAQAMRDKIHEIVDGPPCPATADLATSPLSKPRQTESSSIAQASPAKYAFRRPSENPSRRSSTALDVTASIGGIFVSFMSARVFPTMGIVPGGHGTFEATAVLMLRMVWSRCRRSLVCRPALSGLSFWVPMLPGYCCSHRVLVGAGPT